MKGRVLAVDVGKARIGLAISDEMQIIATPLANLKCAYNLEGTVDLFIAHIKSLGYVIKTIVIGLPLKMSGADSQTTEYARKFAALLKERSEYAVELLDERLTTVQADRSLQEASFSRKRRAALVDSVSAVILLQNYLEVKGLRG